MSLPAIPVPAIPIIDARNAGKPAVMSALAKPARLRVVLDAGDRTYTLWGYGPRCCCPTRGWR